MRRNGFTMVELIFVIIIIGILSVAAIPKFGDIKDRAKVNAEYSSLSGLDSAAVTKMEFHREDNPDGNILIDWHAMGDDAYDLTGANLTASYTAVNTAKKVLKGIIKKGDDFKIVAYVDSGTAGVLDADGADDILFIKGAASNATSGVSKSPDVIGKPDKNDVWVFNGSGSSATVKAGAAGTETVVESGEIALIDLPGTTATTFVEDADADAAGEVSIDCVVATVSTAHATIEEP